MTLGALGNVTDNDSVIPQGDSAELRAYIDDDELILVAADDIASVQFVVQDPNGDKTDYVGVVEDDGAGFYRLLDTMVLGKYLWVARFTLVSGQVRSRRGTFVIVDPFTNLVPDAYQSVADAVWMRLEDCFDSQEGGPWLKDMTMSYFDKSKIPRFVNQGLLLVNYTNPITSLDAKYFWTPIDPNLPPEALDYTNDPDSYIIVEATFLAVVRHLMTSYVEQPDTVGANVVRDTRRDYLQRWGTIYQLESDAFKSQLGLWKRQFLHFGHGKLLVDNKQGRLQPAYNRTRNVGRGRM